MLTLFGKPVAKNILDQVRDKAKQFEKASGHRAKLVVVLVGEDPASLIYIRKKGETAELLGLDHETIKLPISITPDELREYIDQLNANPRVHGILIQRPLPKFTDETEVASWIVPEKDVDAFHPLNVGRLFLGLPCLKPCTPAGIMEIFKHYKIPVSGKKACVIGRSAIVGKPMAALLLKENATVFHCHSKTPDLKSITQFSDILVVAAGKPHLIDASYVKQGAVVIDVGIHHNTNGKIIGDVVFEDVAKVASALSPVPSGVGPMTIAMLMKNTMDAALELANSGSSLP